MEHTMKAVLFSIFFYFMAIGHALAEDPFITVVTEEWPPYSFSKDGYQYGTSTAIVRAALDDAGFKYTIASYPWARAYDLAQRTENVLIYTIARTQEREDKFKWVSRIEPNDPTYFYRKTGNVAISANTIEEAKKYRGVTLRSSFTHQSLSELGFKPGQNLILTNDPFTGLKMLMSGNADLYTSSTANVLKILEDVGYPKNSLEIQAHIMDSQLYAAFSLKTDDKIILKLRHSIEKVMNAKK